MFENVWKSGFPPKTIIFGHVRKMFLKGFRLFRTDSEKELKLILKFLTPIP